MPKKKTKKKTATFKKKDGKKVDIPVNEKFCKNCGFEKIWACPEHGCGSEERVGEKKSEIKVSSRRIRR